MRNVSVLILSLLLLGACATQPSRVQLLRPQIALGQLPVARFILEHPGPLSIGFRMRIVNPSGEPITLRRLELQTVGTGAYLLRRLPLYFNQTIGPNETGMLSFNAWAYAQGGRLGATEPVTVRGIAYFESPTGKFQQFFTQHILPLAGGD